MSTNQHTIPAANVARLLAKILNEHSLKFHTRQIIAHFANEQSLNLSDTSDNANLHFCNAWHIKLQLAIILNCHDLRDDTRTLLTDFICNNGINISEAVED